MDEEFEIPGAPSADEIRDQLIETGGPAYWRPHGVPDGSATDFEALDHETAAKVIAARLAVGPGPHGNGYQQALHEHHQNILNLEREQARLLEQATEIREYDPVTGEGVSMASPQRQKAIIDRLSVIADSLARAHGEPGRMTLERKLDEAVKAEQAGYRAAYIQQEAQRRAAAAALEADIERAAQGYAKVQPR